MLQRVVNTATVVMAEHDVHVVRTVATRVTAFAEGKTIAGSCKDGASLVVIDKHGVPLLLPKPKKK